MPHAEVLPDRNAVDSHRPWLLLLAALAATLLALFWSLLLGEAGTPWRLAILFGGLLASGCAITLCPQSPCVLGFSSAIGLVAYAGMHPAWDSVRHPVLILSGCAALAG